MNLQNSLKRVSLPIWTIALATVLVWCVDNVRTKTNDTVVWEWNPVTTITEKKSSLLMPNETVTNWVENDNSNLYSSVSIANEDSSVSIANEGSPFSIADAFSSVSTGDGFPFVSYDVNSVLSIKDQVNSRGGFDLSGLFEKKECENGLWTYMKRSAWLQAPWEKGEEVCI